MALLQPLKISAVLHASLMPIILMVISSGVRSVDETAFVFQIDHGQKERSKFGCFMTV